MNFKIGDIVTDKVKSFRGRNHFEIVSFENAGTVAVKVIKSKNSDLTTIGKIYVPLSAMVLVENQPRITGHHLTKIFK